jgi:4-amino-4-deoxy-L-arabinose transferase-like glycosyltransferase
MFPWCIFNYQGLRLMVAGLGKDDHLRRAYLLLIAWITVWIAVFSISGTKLPHYVLPAYPAVAMFFGVFIDRWLSRDVQYSRAWMRTSWISLIVVGIAFLIGSRILLESVLPDETHLMLIGLIPLIGGVIGWWAYEVDRRQAAAMTVLATAAAFTLALFAWAAPQVDRYQTSPQIARWVSDHAGPNQASIKTFGYFDESLVYYTGQQVKPLKEVEQVGEFLKGDPGGLLITTSQAIEGLSAQLPPDVIQLETTPRFLREGQLLLLGRRKATATVAQPASDQPRR